MSILSNLRDYIASYTQLKSGAPVWVDFLGPAATQYAIVAMPGRRIVEWYLDNSSMREFPFALQSMESTASQLARLDNNNFYELFADWLESQWLAGIMPNLGAGKTAFKIEALSWGFLYEQGQSETGIYQISCKLTYTQDRQP